MNKFNLNNVSMKFNDEDITNALMNIKDNQCRLSSGVYVGHMFIGDLKVILALKKPSEYVTLNYDVYTPNGLAWERYNEGTLLDYSNFRTIESYESFKQKLFDDLESHFEKDDLLYNLAFNSDQFVYRYDIASFLKQKLEQAAQIEPNEQKMETDYDDNEFEI